MKTLYDFLKNINRYPSYGELVPVGTRSYDRISAHISVPPAHTPTVALAKAYSNSTVNGKHIKVTSQDITQEVKAWVQMDLQNGSEP